MTKPKPWSEKEDKFLVTAVKSGNKAKEIAFFLGRSEKSVQYRCNRLHIDVSAVKEKQKAKSFDNADVRCPFFEKFYRGKSIKCEGLIGDGYITLGFSTEGEWKNQVKTFCNGEYLNCPVAQMLETKYARKNEK